MVVDFARARIAFKAHEPPVFQPHVVEVVAQTRLEEAHGTLVYDRGVAQLPVFADKRAVHAHAHLVRLVLGMRLIAFGCGRGQAGGAVNRACALEEDAVVACQAIAVGHGDRRRIARERPGRVRRARREALLKLLHQLHLAVELENGGRVVFGIAVSEPVHVPVAVHAHEARHVVLAVHVVEPRVGRRFARRREIIAFSRADFDGELPAGGRIRRVGRRAEQALRARVIVVGARHADRTALRIVGQRVRFAVFQLRDELVGKRLACIGEQLGVLRVGERNVHALVRVGMREVAAVEVELHAQVIGRPRQRAVRSGVFQLAAHDLRHVLVLFEHALEIVLLVHCRIDELGQLRRVGDEVAQCKLLACGGVVDVRGETQLLAPAVDFGDARFQQARQAAVGARHGGLADEVDEVDRLHGVVDAAEQNVELVPFGRALRIRVVRVVVHPVDGCRGGQLVAAFECGLQLVVARGFNGDFGVFAITAVARLLADLRIVASRGAHLKLFHNAHVLLIWAVAGSCRRTCPVCRASAKRNEACEGEGQDEGEGQGNRGTAGFNHDVSERNKRR